MRRARLSCVVAALLTVGLFGSSTRDVLPAESFADPAFQSTWERTDKPVADGTVKRSFYWGPTPGQQQMEPYAEGRSGKRLVQYFDKSRMEINDPSGNRSDPFYVTNGLLTVELITGRMQTGNNLFVDRYPAEIPLASDTDDTSAPTYASFGKLLGKAPNLLGQAPHLILDRQGNVTTGPPDSTSPDLAFAYYEAATGHNINKLFWDFLNSTGPTWQNGKLTTTRLSDPWFYTSGLPVSEAYWAKVKIAGQRDVDVAVQAFQRRVLTYVPSFPKEFQVQMGNIGQHYFDWRYRSAGQPGGGVQQATVTPTQAPGSNGNLVVTGAVANTLNLSTAALMARKPETISATFVEQGGTSQTHAFKGPLLLDLLRSAGGQGKAGRDLLGRYIVATGKNNQQVVVSWGEIDPIFAGTRAIVAYEQDGTDMGGEHGPFRLVIPSDKSGSRSLYGLTKLEVRSIAAQQPGGGVLRLTGAASNPLSLTPTDLAARNPTTVQTTYMAGGQVETHTYRGVLLSQLLSEAHVRTGSNPQQEFLTKYIVAAGNDGRQAIISWGELDPSYSGSRVIVAYEENGVPLGSLTRLVVPSDARGGRYTPYLLSLDVRDAGQ